MKKEIGVVKQFEETVDVCDFCEKVLHDDAWIQWDSTEYDKWLESTTGVIYDVCSMDCLQKLLYFRVTSSDDIVFAETGVTILLDKNSAKILYSLICKDYS